MNEHHDLMLDRGWIAVRDLEGNVVEWRDPTEERNVWPEWEARSFYEAGDCGSVPPLRRVAGVRNGEQGEAT